MTLSATLLTGLAGPLFELIDDIFTSDEERAEAKRKLLSQEGRRSLQQLEINMSAIVAEAKSADPWTSRARPSFLYVIYVMILGAIPMGFLSAFHPEVSQRVIEGMQGWFAAIPDALWGLFGAGYLGYSGFRSWDKKKLSK